MLNPDSIEGQPQQPAAAPAPGTETEAEVSITESGESYTSEPAPEAAPDIKGAVSAERGPSGTLDELSQIDPDLLSGKTGPDMEPDADTKLPAKSVHEKTGEKICRFGWIDFIDDPNVVKALMDTVEGYACEKGMDTMNGPMGFLEFDAAGVLVKGYDKLPTAYGKYNAPYYEQHLLDLGYVKDADYVEYLIKVPDVIPERYARMAELVSIKNSLHQAVIHNRIELMPYLDGLFRCLNSAYSKLHGFSELTPGQCDDLKKQFLSNINVDYVSIVLDADEHVVGFGVALPSLSKAMQKAKGSLFPFGWIHMLKALKQNDTLDLLLIAIDEKYKNKGVNAMIFDKFAQGITKNGVKYIESTRELEDNTSVQNLWRYLEHELTKRARTYIKHLEG